ncbi:uncharacterized protein LOC132397195 isoform X2 [Hypanus sabinus]|uniref:uncharacterized protein LOC132397195 isoform X2 n=1 Tax=Hypanus sabinus TaxID=79690 RepID=UPI0028C41CBB|nr:uncharacterized protein LOC132397195 isoform X2 [Hypanus sabinus]
MTLISQDMPLSYCYQQRGANVVSSNMLSRTGEEQENKGPEELTEEDAKMKESKDYSLFESLCDTVQSSLVLLQNSIGELLDFKDQMMNHPLPSNLLAHLVVTTGKIFRSASDLFTPTTELVRLARFYATPWEQKKEILEHIYVNHERKKHQLSVALRKLQLLDSQAKWLARERQILNWEKLFTKLMTAKTHGRRWKFRLEYLKRKGELSSESQTFMGSPIYPEMSDGQIDPKQRVLKEAESLKRLVIKEHQEADTEESNEEEDSDLEQVEAQGERGGGAVLKKDTIDGETQTEQQTEEQGTWTGDPLHTRFACLSATKFYGCFEQGLSCLLTYQRERQKIQLVQDQARQNHKAPKQVKINESQNDLPVTVSVSGILKASEAPNSDFANTVVEHVLNSGQGAKFEMVKGSAVVEVLLFHDQKGVIAEGEFKLPQDMLMQQKLVSDTEIQLFTPGSARSPPRTVAALCLSLCVEELVESMWKDQSTEAWSLEEVILDATGIDLKETSQDELEKCLRKPELRESCTSAMSWASSSMVKPGFVPDEQVQLLIEEHNLQLSQQQEMHQKQMKSLLESFRSSIPDIPLDHTFLTDELEKIPRSENAQLTTENRDYETKGGQALNHSARDIRSAQGGPRPPPKSAATRQKISMSKSLLLKKKFPVNVWERMKILEENMWRNKHNTIERLQSETSSKLEKQLSVQKRLQVHSDNMENDSRSKDEICFPALFMPMRLRQIYTPKARLYFHPSGSAGFYRLTQAPSVISLPPLGSSTRMSVLNLLNPSITLPVTSAGQDDHNPEEDGTVLNRVTPEPYPIYESWAGSMSLPEERY